MTSIKRGCSLGDVDELAVVQRDEHKIMRSRTHSPVSRSIVNSGEHVIPIQKIRRSQIPIAKRRRSICRIPHIDVETVEQLGITKSNKTVHLFNPFCSKECTLCNNPAAIAPPYTEPVFVGPNPVSFHTLFPAWDFSLQRFKLESFCNDPFCRLHETLLDEELRGLRKVCTYNHDWNVTRSEIDPLCLLNEKLLDKEIRNRRIKCTSNHEWKMDRPEIEDIRRCAQPL